MSYQPQTSSAILKGEGEMKEAKVRVSRLTIGRLFNTGNYEHVRYELTIEIQDGVSVRAVLKAAELALDGLNPKEPFSEFDLRQAREIISKPSGQLNQWDLSNLEAYKQRIAAYDAWMSKRQDARVSLDKLGELSEKHTDAKDNWDLDNQ
jgi:hypothetical protein